MKLLIILSAVLALGATDAFATISKASKTTCVNGRCREVGTINGITPFTRHYNEWNFSQNQLQQDAIAYVATKGDEVGPSLVAQSQATGLSLEETAAAVIKTDGIEIGG
jgi:hypothetical protein